MSAPTGNTGGAEVADAVNERDEEHLEIGRWIEEQRRRGDTWDTITADLAVTDTYGQAAHRLYCDHRDRIAAAAQWSLFAPEPEEQLPLFLAPAPHYPAPHTPAPHDRNGTTTP